jgi:hypothetical protein
MKARSVFVLGIVLLFGMRASAQSDPKIEVTADYSYAHANPQNNSIIPTFSLNGGGGSVAFFFSEHIGIEAEFLKAMVAIRTTLLSRRPTAMDLVVYRLRTICSPTT